MRADYLDGANLQQRSQHIGCSTVFDNPAANNPVDVYTSEGYSFACWFDPQPQAPVSATGRYACGHPFTFCNLSLDRKLKIGIGLANAVNMRLGALDTNYMLLPTVGSPPVKCC